MQRALQARRPSPSTRLLRPRASVSRKIAGPDRRQGRVADLSDQHAGPNAHDQTFLPVFTKKERPV